MTNNNTDELRSILQNYIGSVYAKAVETTGDAERAKSITRRVMTLLKRTYEAGMAPNDEMVNRLTQDCCQEDEYYQSRQAIFKDGAIADMPDFDTAISSISQEQLDAAAKAEEKAIPAPVAAPSLYDDEDEDDDEDYDDEDEDEDEDDDDDDDEAEDDEDEDSYRPERKSNANGGAIAVLTILAVILAVLTFCLVIMVMTRGILPGGDSAFVKNFTEWFNSNLFLLY